QLVIDARATQQKVVLLDRLKPAHVAAARGGAARDAFVNLWGQSATQLAGVDEAKVYQADSDRWSRGATALNRFLAAVAANGPEGEIAARWAETQSLGAAPAAAPHRARAEKAKPRAERLHELAKVPNAVSEDSDRQLVSLWDDALLGPCAEAAGYRKRAE